MTDLAKQCMEAIVLYTDMTVPHPFMLRPEKKLFDLAPQCREALANELLKEEAARLLDNEHVDPCTVQQMLC